MDIRRKFVVQQGKTTRNLKLKNWDPDYDARKKKQDVEQELALLSTQMRRLQYELFADDSHSLVIILQGVDASGKDGTIRHVMGALNPQSSYVKSFKVPTPEELSHDYLWR